MSRPPDMPPAPIALAAGIAIVGVQLLLIMWIAEWAQEARKRNARSR